ncbi:MAG TPA: hypothetical protein VF439_00480 [Candidatus Paceibacterota bacterium]
MSELVNDAERTRVKEAWAKDPFRILAQEVAVEIYRATFEAPVEGGPSEQEFAISLMVAEHEHEDDPDPFLADFEEFIDVEGERHQSMNPRG